MNLYIYANENSFTNNQIQLLKTKFANVKFYSEANYKLVIQDQAPKVLALDPDIIGWELPNKIIEKVPNLKAICLQTTGYEWIDIDFCNKHNITVTNVPHYASVSVAEKCIFMALALANKFSRFQQEGRMNYTSEFIGTEMWDKPTDIIGFGEIGHALAERLEGLVGNKELCYYSHNQNDPRFHYQPFEDMLERSEFMFITLSKNPDSIALFDDLSKFNRNMKVIVISNGFEEVTKRLVEKCEAGQLGGVAFESDDPKILQHHYRSNIFVTPPNAWYTTEALERLFKIWVESILSVPDGEVRNQVGTGC